jgi:hypothetical protein
MVTEDILMAVDITLPHTIHTIHINRRFKMYARYQPYSYHRRYYNPYYSYSRNIVDSQVSEVNQSINNFGDMIDVTQNSDVYQLMTPEPEMVEDVAQCDPPTPPAEPSRLILPI